MMLLPEPVAKGVATTISREILRRKGKEFDNPVRLKIEEDLLTHSFEIRDTTKPVVTAETPIKGGGKK